MAVRKEVARRTPPVRDPTLASIPTVTGLAIAGTVLLLLAYIMPFQGGPAGYSLLFGRRSSGAFSVALVVTGLLRAVAHIVLLVGGLLLRLPSSLRALPAGALLGIGTMEALHFLWLLVAGNLLNAAAWLGFLGGIATIAAGLLAISRAYRDHP